MIQNPELNIVECIESLDNRKKYLVSQRSDDNFKISVDSVTTLATDLGSLNWNLQGSLPSLPGEEEKIIIYCLVNRENEKTLLTSKEGQSFLGWGDSSNDRKSLSPLLDNATTFQTLFPQTVPSCVQGNVPFPRGLMCLFWNGIPCLKVDVNNANS
ncbi:hypothetical protein TNCV_2889381 [Trichonephila clavipes]|nr:hypothetical protein TNCV_2889381 [Trichonephila clavipes]